MSGIHPLFIALTQAAVSFWSKAVRRRVLHFSNSFEGHSLFASDLLNFPPAFSPDGGFQLHPHYRTRRPIDELLRKIRPASTSLLLKSMHLKLKPSWANGGQGY